MVSAHVSLCIDADLGFDVSHAACPAPFPPSRIMGGRERVNNDRDRVVIGRAVVALCWRRVPAPSRRQCRERGRRVPSLSAPRPTAAPFSSHGTRGSQGRTQWPTSWDAIASTLFLRAWLGSAPRLGGVPSFALPTLNVHFRHYWHFWLLCFTHSWHSGRLHSGILGFLVSLFAAFLVFDFRHSWNSWFFISGIHGHSCLTILGNLGRASGLWSIGAPQNISCSNTSVKTHSRKQT